MKICLGKMASIMLVFSIVCIAGCGANPVELNRQARQYINQDNFDGAQKLLEKSLKADFEMAQTHYWLGYCYEQQRLLDRAVYEYNLAVSFDPVLDEAQIALARAYYMKGMQSKSLKVARKFLRDKPGGMDDFIKIGQEFLKYNMEQQAVLALHRAVQADGNNARALVVLADYYLAKGDQEKGVDYLIQAFKKNPLYPGLAKRLGRYGMKVDIPQAKKAAAGQGKK